MDGLAGMLAVNLTSIISLLPTEAIRRCHFGGCPQEETRKCSIVLIICVGEGSN